jgi:gliding motility-associated-like protein
MILMRLTLIICFCLLFCRLVDGQQNLVPNPSFEDISSCPSLAYGLIDLAPPWLNAISTPNLFHVCSSPFGSGVPINGITCYQEARTGVGYAGLLPYFVVPKTTEFMEAKLTQKLTKGQQYYISFYASPRNCSDFQACYSDRLGLAFSDTLYQEGVSTGIELIPPYKPVIENPPGEIMTDTVNWKEIGGCYVADGTEQYVLIGNFVANNKTQSKNCLGVSGSYYYIDDVGVYVFNPLEDTLVLCKGETALIGKPFADANYAWNTGQSDASIEISKAGTYIVNVIFRNCLLSDTIVVLEMDELISGLSADVLYCEEEALKMDIPIKGTFAWSTGDSSSSILIREEGIYSFTVENQCGVFSQTFKAISQKCECSIYVPNVFSPDGNGINDYLECGVDCDLPFASKGFHIFDRWGSKVYSNLSTDFSSIKWDGRYKGKDLSNGVYTWVFEYEVAFKGDFLKKTVCGDVAIIR